MMSVAYHETGGDHLRCSYASGEERFLGSTKWSRMNKRGKLERGIYVQPGEPTASPLALVADADDVFDNDRCVLASWDPCTYADS